MMRVVILEDEQAFLNELVFSEPWETWNCMVVGSAQDGLGALGLIQEKKPDLVLTDIRLPGKSGLQIIEEISQLSLEIQPEWIIISGYDEFEYARTALRLGVRNYLLKPLDDDELAATIQKIRSDWETRREREHLEAALRENHQSTLMLFQEYHLNQDQESHLRYVSQAVTHIHDCYQRDLTVEDAAQKLRISSGYLSRIFKQETGYSFTEYLMYYRIKRAVELLKDPDLRIYEVADLVGYADQRYFSQIFKRLVGMTPREFKITRSSP